jgi:tetratricopeptide (TPR) repeat protein
VPLFVQEVVRALAARSDPAAPDDDAPDTVIPASVHEMLAGRLDRLGDAKQIAQAASVIGREFRREVLAKVCAEQFGLAADALEDGLQTLATAGVLTEGTDGGRAGSFVHALLCDAAYDSLLREPRQALHRLVAQSLLASDGETAAYRPELLAWHLEAGADAAAALPYWLEAARRNLAASALVEATRLLERGLASLDQMPQTQETDERRLEFMTLLGPALMALKGFGSPEANRLYARANELCQALPESPRNFPIYWGWWRVSRDNASRSERARTLLARARRRQDPELLLQAYHCGWASEFFVGNYELCCEHARAGLAIYDQHDYRHHAHIYGGHDAKVCGHGELALAWWMMGMPHDAAAQDRLSLDWAHRLDHLGSWLHNRENRLYRTSWTRDLDQVAEESEQLLRTSADQGMEDLRAKGLIFLGWATALRSDPVAGLRMLEDGWTRQLAIGTNEDFPVYVSLLAEALIGAGQPERAVETLRGAEADFDESGLWFWRSEVRRMQAEALLAADPRPGAGDLTAQAARVFEEAIDIARQQKAVMLGLRAATGLARLDPGATSLARLRKWLDAVAQDDGGVDITAARALLQAGGIRVVDAVSAGPRS